jgi:hypothetical protein
MSIQVFVFEIGSYEILNMISICQQTIAKLPNTKSYKKKAFQLFSNCQKQTNIKNARRSENSSCFGKRSTKNSKYLILLKGKHE